MSELIEKLARAQKAWFYPEADIRGRYTVHESQQAPSYFSSSDEAAAEVKRRNARAVLSTLADNLTPEMVEAAHTAFRDEHGCSEDLERGTVRAALTAALRTAVGE